MSKSTVPSWVSNLAILAVAAGVAWLIWSLAAENRELKARIAELSRPDPAESLVAGDPLPDVALDGPEGPQSTADLAAEGAVLAFLTTRCPYCERTLPLWSDLQGRLEKSGIPFVAISLDPPAATRQYAALHDIEWPMWTVTDPDEIPRLEVNSVPYTVVVSPEGRVSDVWLGALLEADLEAIGEAVEAKIPGVVRDVTGSRDESPGCCEAPTSSADVGR